TCPHRRRHPMFQRWAWCLPGVLLIGAALAAPAPNSFEPKPYDWPQWLGPERNGMSRETGLLKTWPKEGPPLAWEVKNLGGGYSTPSVSAGRVFGLSFRGQDEVVWALDEATGKELWSRRIAAAKKAQGDEAPEGSRSTPTVDGKRLYALGENGDLVCLETAGG